MKYFSLSYFSRKPLVYLVAPENLLFNPYLVISISHQNFLCKPLLMKHHILLSTITNHWACKKIIAKKYIPFLLFLQNSRVQEHSSDDDPLHILKYHLIAKRRRLISHFKRERVGGDGIITRQQFIEVIKVPINKCVFCFRQGCILKKGWFVKVFF